MLQIKMWLVTAATFTQKLTDAQGTALEEYLRTNDFIFREVPYAHYGAEKAKVNLVYYHSGKLVIQGKDAKDFVEFVLEPKILQEVKLGYEEVLNPELLAPRIGVDESGKGDFFGPLCIAAVYVNQNILQEWKSAGVQDSKNISSDRRIAELAKIIRDTPGCIHTTVTFGNEKYNLRYEEMGSVNKMLAWGHARVIENLLERSAEMIPPPVRAISDQFAYDKATVEKALMKLGRKLELVQRHKAEADMAVAAASILARNEFVTRLSHLGKQFEMEFPKGASAAVDAAAKEFVAKKGAENLVKVAKTHFRTALRAQGLPEPPKVEWKRR